MALAILVGVFATCLCVADGFQFTCPENVTSATPPIVNSTTYSYRVAISIESKKQVIGGYEMYDMANGMVRLYVHFPDKDNSSKWISESVHHDYKHSQTLVYDFDAKTCVVSDLLQNETYSIFGLGIENGFQNPKYSYRWLGDYNYTKENGTFGVDGIGTDKYSTCVLFDNDSMKYDVELYFSADDWDTGSGSNVPLMVLLKVNQTEDDGKNFKTETYTYTFGSYHEGMTSRQWDGSDPHWDIICPGRKDAIPAPEISNTYSSIEEVVNASSKTINTFKRFYDYNEKLYRSDFVAPKNHSWGPMLNHHYTVIHDFHSGVEYLIDQEMGNCSIKPITKGRWDMDVETDPGHPGFFRMRNLNEFNKQRNFTYTGRYTHRGMSVDTWTSAVPFKWNGTHGSGEMSETYLYATPDWRSSDLSPVPIAVKISIKKTTPNGTKTNSMMIRISSVTPKMHGNWFHVGSCYNKESSKAFVLKFDNSYGKYLDEYGGTMDVAIQAGVAKAANISKTRVSPWAQKQLALDAASGNANPEEKLFVSVYVHDHPNVHGNVTEYAPSINLTEAVANLKDAVESNRLQIQFQLISGKIITMTAYPGYFKEQADLFSPAPPDAPFTPTTTPPGGGGSSSGLSNGAVAGLSIGMVVLGFIIGAAVLHLRYKRGGRQFGYNIQD